MATLRLGIYTLIAKCQRLVSIIIIVIIITE